MLNDVLPPFLPNSHPRRENPLSLLVIRNSLFLLYFLLSACAKPDPDFYDWAKEAMQDALFTLEKVRIHPDYSKRFTEYMVNAKAIFIVSGSTKGGMLLGVRGGKGVFLAKDTQGNWSYPAFYKLNSVSFGLQMGVVQTESVTLILTNRTVESMKGGMTNVGAILETGLGSQGSSTESSLSENFRNDIVTFGVSQGAFVGGAANVTHVWPNTALNQQFYQSPQADAESVVFKGKFRNPAADELRQKLYNYSQHK